ncbi:MAG: 3-oxoacid CoA-transferase subunit A [Dehalococcoidia bacterium]|nr:3-oxoacid CoA-transferase subunit A [Dehalococcoidia bacterium]
MGRPQVVGSFAEAVADVHDGATVMVPGFGNAGAPHNLMTALFHQGATDLTIIANGAGGAGSATAEVRTHGDLIEAGRVRKIIASFTAGTHPSRLSKPELLVREGKMEAELNPQGTLAERIRAGGSGIPAFFTPAGIGTLLATGKETREFNGRPYMLETALVADYALIRAWKADTAGNLIYRRSARNFNAIMAMAAKHTIVEVEEPIVPAGELDPDQIHTPGIYVERLVPIGVAGGIVHTQRAAPGGEPPRDKDRSGEKQPLTREEITAVVAQWLEPGWMVNLGVGMPTLTSSYVDPAKGIMFSSENGVIGYSGLAREGEGDPDVVNAGGQQVTLLPGATFVHHADSFALIRRGLIDVTVLGAYEAAADGSFANWRTNNEAWDQLGGIGGAMDLVADAGQIWVAMDHTTRDGQPRLLERCTLPVTSPRNVTMVFTDLGVFRVSGGKFILEQHAVGYTPEEIAAVTGAPLEVSPTLRPITVSV